MGPSRLAPRIPCLVGVILAWGIQAMNRDDARYYQQGKAKQNTTYSTLTPLLTVLLAFESGYNSLRNFAATALVRVGYRFHALTIAIGLR